MAITVNKDGYVLKNGAFVKTEHSNAFKKEIADAIAKADKGTVDDKTTFAIVEKGDGLLKIGRQFHTDGRKLAYSDNDQFEDNPDLIHPGEAVIVNGGDVKFGDVASRGERGEKLAGTSIPSQPPAGASRDSGPPPIPEAVQKKADAAAAEINQMVEKRDQATSPNLEAAYDSALRKRIDELVDANGGWRSDMFAPALRDGIKDPNVRSYINEKIIPAGGE